MNIEGLWKELERINSEMREKMAAFDATNMELRNLEAKIDAIKSANPPHNNGLKRRKK